MIRKGRNTSLKPAQWNSPVGLCQPSWTWDWQVLLGPPGFITHLLLPLQREKTGYGTNSSLLKRNMDQLV